MSGPVRIQLRRARGWRLPEGAVNCARPGPWGNCFVVGVDGDREKCVELHKTLLSGAICVTCKASVADQKRVLRHAAEHMDELRDKDLGCWCRLDGKPCHVDTLLKTANA